MVWVKLDDQFPDHPKIAQAGPLAQLLYVNALAYANRYLTDGFIPQGAVARLVVWDFEGAPSNYELAERLVAARLWETSDGGYRIHDYLDYNPSRAKVLEEREKTRERIAKLRSAKPKCTDEVRTYNPGTTDDVRKMNGCSTPSPVPIPIPNNISLTRDDASHVTQGEIESANADSMPPSAAPLSEPSQATRPYPKPAAPKEKNSPKAGQGKKGGRQLLPEAWDLAAEIIDDMRRNDGTPPRDKEKLKFASAIDKLMRARDSPADAEEIRAMWEWAKTDREVTKIRTWPGRLADCLASYRARQQYEQIEYERRKRL